MNNSQKAVFTMLAAVLLLEFGSLSKLQAVWGMAFGVPETLAPDGVRQGIGETTGMQPTHPSGPTGVPL